MSRAPLASDDGHKKLALGALALVAGVWVLVSQIEILATAYASRRWPTTDAQVTSSTVHTLVGGSYARYRPTVTYRYQVGDKTYFNHRLRFRSSLFARCSSTLKEASRYEPGMHLRISYSREDPVVSVVYPGITWQNIALPGMGIALILLALWGFMRQRLARAHGST